MPASDKVRPRMDSPDYNTICYNERDLLETYSAEKVLTLLAYGAYFDQGAIAKTIAW